MIEQTDTGSTVTVRVQRLLPFGLLVDMTDGRAGIIREREIAWNREARRNWREHYAPGDMLQAIVLGEGRDQQLELSLRLAQHDPWSDLPARYQPGQIINGVVTGIRPYGVFVEIEPGISGLLHRSRLPAWADKQNVADLFWPGDQIKAAIDQLDHQRRRLRLSMRWSESQRWPAPAPRRSSEPGPGYPAPAQVAPATARLPLDLLLQQPTPLAILITEDDQVQLDAIANWLRQTGQYVLTATSAEAALSLIKSKHPGLVLMDFGLPGMNGIEAIQQALSYRPETRCMLMTDWARASEHLAELDQLRALGVRLLIKPFLPEDLLSLLFETLDDAGQPFEAVAPPVAALRPLDNETICLSQLLAQVRAATHAVKAVLFALDPAQRSICIVAEDGFRPLHQDALVDLIYSPVRDVAEDQLIVRVEDTRDVEARVRYLQPLLAFRSCLGVPLPGALRERYGLFLFWSRERSCTDVHETYATAIARHISALLERQQFQARAIEMQRLALLGQLSRALVHEINHQLSPISFTLNDIQDQYAQIERRLACAPETAAAALHMARATLGNLSKGVRRLTETARLFGRMTIHTREPLLYVNTTVEEVVAIVRDMADRAHVTIDVDTTVTLFSAHTPAAQVQQILLNILINAIQQIDLLRPGQGGHIRIRMGHERRDQSAVLTISIEDDGPGIHRRLWERIFELGFTTRSEGGSGLGLYITRSLIETLGGRAYVAESALLWGTTFVVELPAAG